MPNDDLLDRLSRTGVTTDADVRDLVLGLLDRAIRRQCWLVFLGAHGLPVQLLVPIADLPYEPDIGDGDLLANFAAKALESVDAAQVILAWERPGARSMYPVDWAWAHEVEGAFASAGITLRGQVLVHRDGAELLELDVPEAA
jgi:hypothetical protein